MDTEKTGTYLAMLRRAKGMTQQEVADCLGVSNKTVSKWESAGGFPDITALPALAELYGVTADDILAGETLTNRRIAALEETAAQRRRLMARLQMRFDVCLAVSLALAVLAWLGIPYVSLAALPLSIAMAWVGYILVTHPIRYGGVAAEGTLWRNLYRKLLAASAVQWWALLRILRIGKAEMDWEALVVRGAYDDWKPVMFCVGLLAICAALRWSLKRTAGVELLPGPWKVWLAWGLWLTCFLVLWTLADGQYNQALAPWLERYSSLEYIERRPQLQEQFHAEIQSYIRARQFVRAAGGVSGLGLLAWTLRGIFRRKKQKDTLADPQK